MQDVVRQLERHVPAMRSQVKCPSLMTDTWTVTSTGALTPGFKMHDTHYAHDELWTKCVFKTGVSAMVMHLNDNHRASREEIADWLDTLDLDLSFPTEPLPPPLRPTPDRYIAAKELFIAPIASATTGMGKSTWFGGNFSTKFYVIDEFCSAMKFLQQSTLGVHFSASAFYAKLGMPESWEIQKVKLLPPLQSCDPLNPVKSSALDAMTESAKRFKRSPHQDHAHIANISQPAETPQRQTPANKKTRTK